MYQHKSHAVKGFTQKYNVTRLVWFEAGVDMRAAISREKQIKAGNRLRKIALIEAMNPEWKDLYNGLL
jgi:putative endonuclease